MPEAAHRVVLPVSDAHIGYIRNLWGPIEISGGGSLHVTNAGKRAVLRTSHWYRILSEYLIVTINMEGTES
jgi:hypothetical protein